MKIDKPAIRVKKTGRVITAPSKAWAHDQIEARDHIKKKKVKEGFVTDTGQFVGRRKAQKIAEKAGQMPAKGEKLHTSELRKSLNIKKKVIR